MIYADYAATSPMMPRALDVLTDTARRVYGNPSSLHDAGEEAAGIVETARRQCASLIHAKPHEIVFKTLAARGDKSGLVVFCIPCAAELDMKAAAAASGNKSIELLHVKDLLAATGYIRGGVSPIGMKKSYPTYIDASAEQHERITLSAGVKGAQLLLDRAEIIKFLGARVCPITR